MGSATDGNGNQPIDAVEEADLEEIDGGSDADATETTGSQVPSKPRKYRSPKAVIDLDMNSGGKRFEDFAKEKGSPSEHTVRYLIAAAWLAQYPKIPTVSVDHVFTCYKSAGWMFDVTDPGFPFRRLKRDGMGDTKSGKFTINHLGISRVEKMKPSQS